MNPHAQMELAVKALTAMKGDDLVRCRMRFSRCTKAEMQQQHGESGKTRQEWLDMAIAYEAKIDAAIAWVKGRA